MPFTGPAPTNRLPFVPGNVQTVDARAEALEGKIGAPHVRREPGQDLPTFLVDRERIVDVLRVLKTDPQLRFTLPLDCFGVDYPRRKEGRFDIVYQLYSLENNERIRLKVRTDEKTPVPSSLPVYKGFDWFEREIFDMYGVRFEGHPNLRRILTHEAFRGHPLRKDYDPAQRWILTEKDV
ncbi:MAG TPA: NADH-quinone oxidoreductase subunit C, partial [Thermoanaerobaculia bacterium]